MQIAADRALDRDVDVRYAVAVVLLGDDGRPTAPHHVASDLGRPVRDRQQGHQIDCSFGQFGGLDLPPTTDPASRRSASGLGNLPTQQEVTSV